MQETLPALNRRKPRKIEVRILSTIKKLKEAGMEKGTSILGVPEVVQVASQIQTLVSLARYSSTSSNFLQSEMAVSLSQKTNKTMDDLASKNDVTTTFRQYLATSQNVLPTPGHRQVVSSALLLHSLPSPQDARDLYQDLKNKHNPLKLAKLLRKSSSPASLYRLL